MVLIKLLAVLYLKRRAALLIGPHGIGKSSILEQLKALLGLDNVIVRDLSIMEPCDLAGVPQFRKGKTYYATPSWLPTRGTGIIVLEELNRCPPHMRAPAMQLLTARTLNDYTLPPGWSIMAAINPDEGDYQVQTMDPALLSPALTNTA
jgi:MoxR-like ATPase